MMKIIVLDALTIYLIVLVGRAPFANEKRPQQ
jgi:hypothetical protein